MVTRKLWVLVPVFALALAASVYADTTTDATSTNRRQDRQEVRQRIAAKRCQVGEHLIGVRINRYDNNKLLALRFGERVVKVAENLIAKAADADIDTEKAEDALGEFKTRLEALQEKYAAHIEDLRGTQGFACGESDGSFKEALQEARESLKEARDAMLEVRSYYQSDLRPALIELRQKLAQSNSQATSTNSN